MTLRSKLLLWYSGVFFLSAAVLVGSMYLLIAHKTKQDFFRYLSDEYKEAQRIVLGNMDNEEAMRQFVKIEVEGGKYFPLSFRLYDVAQGTDILLMAPEWEEKLPEKLRLDEVGVAVQPADLAGHGAHGVGEVGGGLGLTFDQQRVLDRQ